MDKQLSQATGDTNYMRNGIIGDLSLPDPETVAIELCWPNIGLSDYQIDLAAFPPEPQPSDGTIDPSNLLASPSPVADYTALIDEWTQSFTNTDLDSGLGPDQDLLSLADHGPLGVYNRVPQLDGSTDTSARDVDGREFKSKRAAKSRHASNKIIDKVNRVTKRFAADKLAILTKWAQSHRAYPYLEQDDALELSQETGLSKKQVRDWFTNWRTREKRLKDQPARLIAGVESDCKLTAQDDNGLSGIASDVCTQYDPYLKSLRDLTLPTHGSRAIDSLFDPSSQLMEGLHLGPLAGMDGSSQNTTDDDPQKMTNGDHNAAHKSFETLESSLNVGFGSLRTNRSPRSIGSDRPQSPTSEVAIALSVGTRLSTKIIRRPVSVAIERFLLEPEEAARPTDILEAVSQLLPTPCLSPPYSPVPSKEYNRSDVSERSLAHDILLHEWLSDERWGMDVPYLQGANPFQQSSEEEDSPLAEEIRIQEVNLKNATLDGSLISSIPHASQSTRVETKVGLSTSPYSPRKRSRVLSIVPSDWRSDISVGSRRYAHSIATDRSIDSRIRSVQHNEGLTNI